MKLNYLKNMKNVILKIVLLLVVMSCGSGDKGELVGVKGKKYFSEKPFGMSLVPGGSFIKENIFDPFKNLIVPGSPEAVPSGLQGKIKTPPLGNTPMPVQMASNTQQKNPQTNLTRNEEALLSPTEKVIASRT